MERMSFGERAIMGIESEDGRVLAALIRDMQKACMEIWVVVGNIGKSAHGLNWAIRTR